MQAIDSGKEARVQKYLAQRWRYEIELEFLRTASAFAEMQRVSSFFARHAGQRDNFLLKDPDDYAVSDHGFGVGDGAKTKFPLQRTPGGTWQDVLGFWSTYTKPRTNYLVRSQEFNDAAWAKNGTATATADTAIAPNGTLTADTINLPTLGDYLGQNQTISGVTVGTTWVWSVWLFGTAGQTMQIDLQALGGTTEPLPSFVVTLTGAPQRVFTSGTVANSGHTGMFVAMSRATGETAASFKAWGAQLENGLVPTRYIPTISSAVRADPSYWTADQTTGALVGPSTSDGFEPVTEPDWASVSIFKDGVAQAAPSAWTSGAGGMVVLAAAPAAGAALSWTGNFYRRVRLNDDELILNRFLPGYYRGSIELMSVI